MANGAFDHYDPADLQNVIDNQAQTFNLMKDKKKKNSTVFVSLSMIFLTVPSSRGTANSSGLCSHVVGICLSAPLF